MAKKSNLLIWAALAAGAFFLMRPGGALAIKKGGEAEEPDITPEPGETPEAKQLDAVIDVQKEKISVPEAIDRARDIATTVQDAAVLIKTPDGQSNIAVTTGKKRRIFKGKRRKPIKISKQTQKKLLAEAAKKCSKVKGQKARLACRRQAVASSRQGLRNLSNMQFR